MEDFEKKVKITEAMDIENGADSSKTLQLLRRFLQIQQRRAQAYANMRRVFVNTPGDGWDDLLWTVKLL
ncbi:hypothetical protein CK203_040250 [Vitis vinifera]|uniref:Uncharacterized protein n=1 Tax=Vitis vinifera TaxID=29760 RepID=A0A438HX99_VITVI|nr:hypothetical protein CK203_040250 [Vitis vinifera]